MAIQAYYGKLKNHEDRPMSDQAKVMAFLMSPDAYPGNPGPITRADTHCAAVFLAGDYAYKLKRAVKLPYLDFSTLEARRKFCERELEINRLTAPDIYLRVVPIVRRTDGSLQIDGEGTTVDWLLVMRRFNSDAVFDHLAENGELNPAIMSMLAHTIWRFHELSPVVKTSGWVQSLSRIVRDLGNSLCNPDATAMGVHFRPTLDALIAAVESGHDLLAERQAQGYVRRCHGDLHLGNIVMHNGEPMLFDAIEFDEEFATIDILYDLAFVVTDLWHRGMLIEANVVFNHYFQRDASPDEWEGLHLMPLFMALRAGIRAMVDMHKFLLNARDSERRAHLWDLHAYVQLARTVLMPRPPLLIVVGGLSGSGKTTLAQMVAPFVGSAPGAVHVRTDVERKLLHHVEFQYRLPPSVYTPESRQVVYQRTMERAEAVLRAGHSVIIDAVFMDAAYRDSVEAMAKRLGVPVHGFWLEAEPLQMMARVTHRVGDASDADPQVVAEQLEAGFTIPDWTRISTRGTLGDAAVAVREILAREV
jgi:aminoglycoside phosphotransferase family enzyme/predicted kinase